MNKVIGLNNNMQPDFSKLKPVGPAQPDFSKLKPVDLKLTPPDRFQAPKKDLSSFNQRIIGDIGSAAKSVGKFTEGALPAIGATGGAILGGIGGAAVGGPVGAYAGAVGGSALGGSLGEATKQGIQNITGERKGVSGGDIAKQGLEMGATEAILGPVLSSVGNLFKLGGKKAVESVIPKSAVESKLLQSYQAGKPFLERITDSLAGKSTSPTTAGKTVFEKGLMGTESMLGVQAKKAGTNIWNNLLAPQLEKSSVKVNLPSFFDAAEKQIIKDTPELGRQKTLLKALEAFKNDYKGMTSVSLKDLQKLKEGWAEFIPEKIYKGESVSGAANTVKDVFADQSRNIIYSVLGPEAKQAYIDYGNLKGIQELGQKAMAGGKLKGGFGSFWNAIKDMALVPAGTVGGQAVYKTGQGIKFLGKPGARILRDLFVGEANQSVPNVSPQQ